MQNKSHSISSSSPSNLTNLLVSFPQIEKHIYTSFYKSYTNDNVYYNSRIINDIIYNEKSHIVATFKDYLIIDDVAEFLKRFYTSIESLIRLPKYFEYYETYSRIYPNYTALPECKFIYKNIHKKQKMIDKQQMKDISTESCENKHKRKDKQEKNIENMNVFSTEVCCSIAEDSSLINEVFGMDKVKKKKKKNKNEININNSNENNKCKDNNNENDKSSKDISENNNKSMLEIIKIVNDIEKGEIKNKQITNSKEQNDKMYTKQINLHLNSNNNNVNNNTTNNDTKSYHIVKAKSIKKSKHNNKQNNYNYWPSTSNISRTKDSFNNSSTNHNISTNPKHRSTISSLLPKSKVNNYFFKNLTMNIFNEIHLNNSPLSNNNIKNKCIFPLTYRNNNGTSDMKIIKNIEAELIKNKIQKHSISKTHRNHRNRNSVISNTKGQINHNSLIVIGNDGYNSVGSHIKSSLSFGNSIHNHSKKCYNVDVSLIRKLISKSSSNKSSANGVGTSNTSTIYHNSNSNNKHALSKNQKHFSKSKNPKKGRNNRNVNSNYTFKTNNVNYTNKYHNSLLLLSSKDNGIKRNKVTSPKGITYNTNYNSNTIKGFKIENFRKITTEIYSGKEIKFIGKGCGSSNDKKQIKKANTDRKTSKVCVKTIKNKK